MNRKSADRKPKAFFLVMMVSDDWILWSYVGNACKRYALACRPSL